MNKKVLVIVAVVLLLLLGGWYFMSQKKTATTPGAQTSTSTSTQPATTMSSLKALIAKGGAQTCSYNSDKSQGLIYMSGGSVRADIDTTVGSVSEKAHMIMKDNTSYIWMDGKTSGFKMSVDLNATPVPGASPSSASQAGIDPNTAMDYKCSGWLPDASKFTLPSGVNFATFAIPSTPQANGTTQPNTCSYCSLLTGNDKTQCLTALNCK